MSNKKISVIMGAFNCEKTIQASINSIVNQTYPNWEFIICEDGSVDGSYLELTKFANSEDRIRIIRNDKNMGLTYSLNKCLEFTTGDYIARMDADDIATPERIEMQVRFLEENPSYGLVGCNAYLINKEKKIVGESLIPQTDHDIQICKVFYNPFYHPTVLLRSEILKENKYDESFIYAQDYELWLRILKKNKGFNLSNKMLYYRVESSKNPEKLKIQALNCLRALVKNNEDPNEYYLRDVKSIRAKLPYIIKNYVKNGNLNLLSFLYYGVYRVYYKSRRK